MRKIKGHKRRPHGKFAGEKLFNFKKFLVFNPKCGLILEIFDKGILGLDLFIFLWLKFLS